MDVLHITTSDDTTHTLAVFVLLLVGGSFVSLLALHLLDRGVNPISEAVSDYGARQHAWFYRIAAIWLGFAGVLTAVMLGDAMFPKPTLLILCMLVFAAARWAITMFPTDLPGEEESVTGIWHTAFAATAFAAIALAAATFPLFAHPDPFWRAHMTVLWATGGAVALLAIATGITRRAALTGIFGLVERLLYLAMFAWFAALALILL